MFGLGKPSRPKAVAFDIIGTTFPLEPLRPRLAALGLPPAALEGWFAGGLRDAFALAVTDAFAPFTDVLDGALAGVLAEQGLSASSAQRKAVIEGLTELPARDGAAAAFAALRWAGCSVLALTNGSASWTRTLLANAGLRELVDHIVSVEEVKLFKPRAEVYRRAADTAGVAPETLALVAAHSWDVHGAKAAGLTTAYLSADRPFSPVMHKADVEGESLMQCAEALLSLSR